MRTLFGFLWAESPSAWWRQAPSWVRAFYIAGFALMWVVALSACSTAQPGIEVRTVEVPTPVPCLPANQIPAEPDTVADQLTGNAAADLPIVAASALMLRAWGREMHVALGACAGS